jgi:hypothetical protein
VLTYADIGPHHRYATGALFDNIRGGEIRVRNRRDSGTGHGWAGAQTMFWNCKSFKENIMVESPVGAMNWGIGCQGLTQLGDGFWEHWNNPVLPRRLYFQQLKDRLGDQAVEHVTIPEQRGTEPIWEALNEWAGIGNFVEFPAGVAEAATPPVAFLLRQNYPNPFNPQTTIEFSINQREHVRIVVYDIMGKTICILTDRTWAAGTHQVLWDGSKTNGTPAASGFYFYQLTMENHKLTRKMVLMR